MLIEGGDEAHDCRFALPSRIDPRFNQNPSWLIGIKIVFFAASAI